MPTIHVELFAGRTLTHFVQPPFYGREFAHALLHIGWLSLPVVGLTAIFTGGALALQIYAGGARFNAEAVVPQIVAIGMVRELGPVLGGLMVAARVASSIAAELGISRRTVEAHRESLMRKLEIHSVAGLTRLALEAGLVADA